MMEKFDLFEISFFRCRRIFSLVYAGEENVSG